MNGLINILYVHRGLHFGGAEQVIFNLCKNLHIRDYNISVCYLNFSGPIGDQLKSIPVNVFKLPAQAENIVKYLSFIDLIRLIKDLNIHIVHSHDIASFIEDARLKLNSG